MEIIFKGKAYKKMSNKHKTNSFDCEHCDASLFSDNDCALAFGCICPSKTPFATYYQAIDEKYQVRSSKLNTDENNKELKIMNLYEALQITAKEIEKLIPGSILKIPKDIPDGEFRVYLLDCTENQISKAYNSFYSILNNYCTEEESDRIIFTVHTPEWSYLYQNVGE